MQNHTRTASTTNLDPRLQLFPNEPERTTRLQRVDVVDLQQSMVANQLVPIIHKTEAGAGVPFSALND